MVQTGYGKSLKNTSLGLLIVIGGLCIASIAGAHVHHDVDFCHKAATTGMTGDCDHQANDAIHASEGDDCCYRESVWQHAFEESTDSINGANLLFGGLTHPEIFSTDAAQCCQTHDDIPNLVSQILSHQALLRAPPLAA